MNLQPDSKTAQTFPLGALLVLLLVTYGYFFQGGQHNENARFDQTRSAVELGQLSIDEYRGNTADVIPYKGKTYPNKAPGLALIGTIPWWLFDQVFQDLPLKDTLKKHLICYLTRWSTVSLFSALAGVTLFVILKRLLANASLALFLTLAYSLGTTAFPYSTLYISHQFSAALLLLSFYQIFAAKEASQGRALGASGISGKVPESWRLFLSGLFAGCSVVSEYPCALALVPLSLYALTVGSRKSRWVYFLAGLALAGACLLFYNWLAFGTALFIPYSVYGTPAAPVFPAHKLGFMGVTWPKWQVLLNITFRPQRGLFFYNPWLVLVIPGILCSIRRSPYRAEMLTAAVIVCAFFIFDAGFGNSIIYWGGANSTGPRHIIPMLPFAVLLIAPLTAQAYLRLFLYPAALCSIAVMLMATAVEPRVPMKFANPIKQLFWESYLRGELATSRSGTFSRELLTTNSVAFNWGKLLDLPPDLQLVPLLLFWLLLIWLLLKRLPAAGIPVSQTGLGQASFQEQAGPAEPREVNYLPFKPAFIICALLTAALIFTPAIANSLGGAWRLFNISQGTDLLIQL